MKKFKVTFILFVLSIILLYICNIDNLPENVVLFEGEELNLNTILGVTLKKDSSKNIEESVAVSANTKGNSYKENVEVSLLGIKVKDINVNIVENTEVMPLRYINWSKALYSWSISCWNVRNNWKRLRKI